MEVDEAGVTGGAQKQERPSTPLPFAFMSLQTIYPITRIIFTHMALGDAVRLQKPQFQQLHSQGQATHSS